ncbi:MAG TPA: S8 family serine peptidase [Jatrophihabitantaceae bacterium]
MTSNAFRQWRRGLLSLAASVVLIAISAPPAHAWPSQYWISLLGYDKAWSVTKGAGVTVAVVDSGVVELGDLKGRVLPGTDLVGGGTDGRADPGYLCHASTGCYSHGTDMALLIGGSGTGAGDQGVAPDVKILPVKVQTRSGAEAPRAAVANGIRWATDHGAQVINLSLGTQGACPEDQGAAIQYAYDHNVIVVAAAGNEHDAVSSPANCAGALAVTANDRNFRPWSGANDGPELAFTCEGVNLPEESLTGKQLPGVSGTSGAAALVSGTFALLRAHFPKLSARDIVTRALYNVHNGLPGHNTLTKKAEGLGYGEILPDRALTQPLPAHASNPIYDHWEGLLGKPSATAGSSPSSSESGSGSAPSSHSTTQVSGIPAAHGTGGGGSSNTGVIIGGVIGAVIVIGGISLLLARRSGRRSANPGFPR